MLDFTRQISKFITWQREVVGIITERSTFNMSLSSLGLWWITENGEKIENSLRLQEIHSHYHHIVWPTVMIFNSVISADREKRRGK